MKAKFLTRTAYLLLTLVLLAAWQPAASVQAKPVTQSTVMLTTYTNPALGFSIGYPAGWEVEEIEDGVTFISVSGLPLLGAAGVLVDLELGSPRLIDLVVMLVMGELCSDFQIQDSGAVVVNGIEWMRTEITCTAEEVLYTLVSYTTGQEDKGYLFVGAAASLFFDLQRENFQAMLESFHFLPARTPTPTLLPDCVVKVRTLNVRKGPGLVYPVVVRGGSCR